MGDVLHDRLRDLRYSSFTAAMIATLAVFAMLMFVGYRNVHGSVDAAIGGAFFFLLPLGLWAFVAFLVGSREWLNPVIAWLVLVWAYLALLIPWPLGILTAWLSWIMLHRVLCFLEERHYEWAHRGRFRALNKVLAGIIYGVPAAFGLIVWIFQGIAWLLIAILNAGTGP